MIVQGQWRGQRLTLTQQPGSLILSIGDPGQNTVFSYDGAGRLWSAYVGDIGHRRGLNGRVLAKWRADNQRQRRWLSSTAADQLIDRAQSLTSELITDLEAVRVDLRRPLPATMLATLRRAAAFTVDAAHADQDDYARLYQPIGILPPDAYLSLVLQMTLGCSFNTCAFCDFYRDRPFRIKSPAEFADHARAVRDYMGDGLPLRKGIFLGDANALVVPMRQLLPLLDALHSAIDVATMGGLYAFLDGFSGEKKSADDYAELVARGLRRVYIGLESGDADLLRLLRKPGTPDDAIAAVAAMKRAGLSVSVIVLLGAGGAQWSARHIRNTSAVLNAMPLTSEDLLYFSELVVTDALPYARLALSADLVALDTAAMQQQAAAIRASLTHPQRPRSSRYDIREFVY